MQVWQTFLSENECTQLKIEVGNFKQYARPIHGEKRTMCKIKYHMHLLSVDFVTKCKNHFQEQSTEIDFDRLHDCSVIWTEIGAREQVWHMDALKRFAVVNVILNSDIPTEFLDLEYIKKDQGLSSKNLDYPLKWVSLMVEETKMIIKPKINPGDAIFFWSQHIHRGPANLSEKERISLYMTFPLKIHLKITTDFAFTNWAWIDAHFECKKKHYHSDNNDEIRPIKQIDFIIKNDLLQLYPHDWNGVAVYESVQKQIEQREKYIADFPSSANLWLVFWQTGQMFLTTVEFLTDKQKVKINYLPTKKFPRQTVECVDLLTWEKDIRKINITKENLNEYNGYSLLVSKEHFLQVQTPCTIYPFSHLCSIDCKVIIPLYISREETTNVYVHPDLVFEIN